MDDELLLELTPEEKSTFKQLQEIILNDYGPKEAETEQIYRFLKARDFNLHRAEAMLRKHIEWRKKTVESLKCFEMNELQKTKFYSNVVTYTKEGEPVIYCDVGNVDFIGLFKSIKFEEFKTGIFKDVLELEKSLFEQTHKLGKRIGKVVVIANVENLQLAQVINRKNIEHFLYFIRLYEANAPERLRSFVAINASSVTTMAYNMAKPVLATVIMSKVKIFGTVGWKEYLLSIVEEDDLPAFLGGKKTASDGNPFCNVPTTWGPIPKHCYFRSPERRLRGKEFVKEYIVKARDSYYLDFDVNTIGSTIFWKFETESGDISFGLFYYSHKQSTLEEEIIPNKTVNAHLEMEEGSHVCEKSGIYILAFDNSYSRLRMKRIFCKVYVKNPDGSEIPITC